MLDDPTGYGRVVRDENGDFVKIVEQADCTPQQREIREVFPSYYCVKTDDLLWSLANIATLIGLLGTVSGLIATFASISRPDLSPSEKQSLLSNGIAEAMYNTALGLGIAVFCMITHVLLHTRSKSIQHDLEGIVERTFNLLTITNKPGF